MYIAQNGAEASGNVTFYERVTKTSGIPAPITVLLDQIQGGEWDEITIEYRSIDDDQKRRDFKQERVPAFTVSGLFPNQRKADQMEKHSGLIAIDLDHIGDVNDLFAQLKNDKYTWALFRSISGNGICCIVKIRGAKHRESFDGLERYYLSKYSVGIDPACKDVNRCRFVSYDPDLYRNPDSETFTDYVQKRRGRPEKINPTFATDNDVEHVLQQLEARRMDITEDYNTWVELAFALHSKYGADGEQYFHRVSQFHPEYDERKTSIKYKSAAGGNGITISTFFHHAKRAGLEIVTPKTDLIQRVAIYARKGRRTADQAINQLQQVDGIEPDESSEIVNRIFSAEHTPKIDDSKDIVTQVEDYISREYSIVYNEITLKYERDGEPLTDRGFNTVYINAKKLMPTVTKDLVFSVIDSDRTKTINPLQEFFQKHSARKPAGLIKQLAKTISSPTGTRGDAIKPDFIEHYLKKWMVGAVAMWHGKHSPLMFVLVGSKQNTGKTYWLRNLLPAGLQPYYAEAELTGDKDENLLMCSKAMIMNDEMSNKSRKDITVMKQLCSKEYFTVRKPYGRSSEDYKRIATLAGTSNSLEILADPTGNRRIIPIEVIALDHEKYNAIDKTDLWMEAFHEYQAGYNFMLNGDDIDQLNANTLEFEEPSAEAELLQKYFRPAGPGEAGRKLTNTEIKIICEDRSGQKISAKKLGMELRKQGFEQSHEQRKRVYVVIATDSAKLSVVV